MKLRHCFILITLVTVLASCKSGLYLKKSASKDLQVMLLGNELNHHMGFLMKDLTSGQTIKSISADQYFTPASNTKVLTLSLGMDILGDSIPFINYYHKDDTLFIQGLGDPTFLHPDFTQERNFSFLQAHKTIVLDQSNFQSERYGRGWSWDDFNGAYQVERSALPIYGNMITFEDEFPSVAFFNGSVNYEPSMEKLVVRRSRRANKFDVTGEKGDGTIKNMPLVISDSLVCELLADTLQSNVIMGSFDTSSIYNTLYSHPVDSVYSPMMQRSDNFFAEQIVLMAAQQQLGLMDELEMLEWSKEQVFKAPDELLWFDGSGLSRYNQFTARSMVYLFEKLNNDIGLERLLPILAKGGKSGTIKDWYAGGDLENNDPYVFAKTGTIRNVHCLSGFLKAKSGRWYVFSFMHNNFPGASSTVKRPMGKVLKYLRSNL